MEVLELIGMVVAENIFLHHPALGYSRTYDGRSRHQRFIVITLQPTQKSPHGRAFDIKAADGLSLSQIRITHLLILGKGGIAYVHGNPAVLFNEPYRFVNVPDAPLGEDIELVKTNLLGDMHIKLHYRKAFGRQLQCCKIGNGVF